VKPALSRKRQGKEVMMFQCYSLGWRGLVVCTAALVCLPSGVRGDGPTPKQVLEKLREQRRLAEAMAERAEAEAQQVRLAVVAQAVKLQEARHKEAMSERDKVQKELEVRQQQVALNEQVLSWATRSFEPGASRVPTPVDRQPELHKRWQRSRDIARQQFLKFPEQSRGAIKTGRALNAFLDLCGEAARQQQLFQRQAAETRATLEAEIAALEQAEASAERDARLARAKGRLQVAVEREELLKDLRGRTKLSEYDCSRIKCLQGVAGPKMAQSVAGDPMPLDWPFLLRGDRYKEHRAAIEAGKQRAIQEIVTAGGMVPKTFEELTEDIERLASAFAKGKQVFLHGRRQEGQAARTDLQGQGAGAAPGSESPGAISWVPHYLETERFIQGLRYSIVRLAAARGEQDVRTARFEGETVEELMAFMVDHNLRFDQSDINSESTYEKLFRAMNEYYLDLYALQLAEQAEQRQVEALKVREEQLRDIVYGRGDAVLLWDDLWEPWRVRLLRGLRR
jgi:hypothetical protein